MSDAGAAPASGHEARLVALEAGRGIAAFIVLLHHLLLGFAPAAKAMLAGSLLGWTQNGAGAVIFFFALSGFVLTFRTFAGRSVGHVVADAIKRWPRLWLAPAVSMLAGALVLIWHLNANADAAADSGSQWLMSFGNAHLPHGFQPGLLDALGQSVTLWFGADANYNSSLWTMQWELLGSFAVFALAGLLAARTGKTAAATFALAAVAATLFEPYLVSFVLGCGLACLLSRSGWRPTRPMAIALLVAGLLLLSYEGAANLFSPLLALPQSGRWLAGLLLQSVGAVAVIAALRSDLERGLSGRFARWLGQLSFPVYLVQVIAICTLGSATFVWAADAPPAVRFACTAAATLALTVVLALPFALLDAWWRRRVSTFVRRAVQRPVKARA
jgi:peptidoglycan/LPS O-acetylase OafA/YrhL